MMGGLSDDQSASVQPIIEAVMRRGCRLDHGWLVRKRGVAIVECDCQRFGRGSSC